MESLSTTAQNYFKTDQKILTELSEFNITELYAKGYVFTRVSKGLFNQTRSLRIDLSKFQLSSENRRVLKKVPDLKCELVNLPYSDYSWEIHKLGKDFYTIKFGDGTMSAAKIKELFLEMDKSNMNGCFKYSLGGLAVGYALSYLNNSIVHYAYPFYDLNIQKDLNLGMSMMISAILWAKNHGKDYFYLGSVVDAKSKYKLQFEGLEWFNGNNWEINIEALKELIK